MPMVVTVLKGDKREIPSNLPPLLWFDLVRECEAIPNLADLPFYHPVMEYLSPEELRRLRAKALVWYEHMGEFPRELAWWWEVRQARRRGDIPHTKEGAVATLEITERGEVLHCGYCGARWSPPFPDRCKLCDRIIDRCKLCDRIILNGGNDAHPTG